MRWRDQRQSENVEDRRGIGGPAMVGADDMIQKRTQGYVVPDSFTHGSAQQRMEWFARGFKSGDMRQCQTFR